MLFKKRDHMPRPPRADEAGGLSDALNRGNPRADVFRNDADFAAFERILQEGLQRYRIELYTYQLMSNHYQLVLRPLIDGEMSRFMGWIGGTPQWIVRNTGDGDHCGDGCRNPNLIQSFSCPLPQLSRWVERVHDPLTKKELDAVRLSAQRGRPLGDDVWVESTAARLNLKSTVRPRGRQQVRSSDDVPGENACPLISSGGTTKRVNRFANSQVNLLRFRDPISRSFRFGQSVTLTRLELRISCGQHQRPHSFLWPVLVFSPQCRCAVSSF